MENGPCTLPSFICSSPPLIYSLHVPLFSLLILLVVLLPHFSPPTLYPPTVSYRSPPRPPPFGSTTSSWSAAPTNPLHPPHGFSGAPLERPCSARRPCYPLAHRSFFLYPTTDTHTHPSTQKHTRTYTPSPSLDNTVPPYLTCSPSSTVQLVCHSPPNSSHSLPHPSLTEHTPGLHIGQVLQRRWHRGHTRLRSSTMLPRICCSQQHTRAHPRRSGRQR